MSFNFDYIHLREIDSTNNFALDYITKTNPKDGFCIFTDYQTSGKGQYGRQWESEIGQNLLCSIILNPTSFNIERLFELHIISSLAIIKTLNELSLKKLTIKWPNDIYVSNNKIAGILIQNVMRGSKVVSSIIGIGININQTHFNLISNVSSVKIEKACQYEIKTILSKLHNNLMSYYNHIKNETANNLLNDYNNHLYFKGNKIQFRNKTDEFKKGKLIEVNNLGQLIIEFIDESLRFDFGTVEIKYIN